MFGSLEREWGGEEWKMEINISYFFLDVLKIKRKRGVNFTSFGKII